MKEGEEKMRMQLLFVVHSCAPRLPCQHFTCENQDEINLMYHPWVMHSECSDIPPIEEWRLTVFFYPVAGVGMDKPFQTEFRVGVFGAKHVLPVHLNLAPSGAGAAFEELGTRSLSMVILFDFGTLTARLTFFSQHDMRFSPCNNQVRLESNSKFHSFFAVGRYQQHCVVSFHLLPGDDTRESQLKELISSSDKVTQLVNGLVKLRDFDSSVCEQVQQLFSN